MNSLIALVIIFGSYSTPIQLQPIIDGDVLISNTLSYWGEICTDAKIYDDPYGLHKTQYSVYVGETVTLREQHEQWVMIKPAKWIPLSALCCRER